MGALVTIVGAVLVVILLIWMLRLVFRTWQSYVRPWASRTIANLRRLPRNDEEELRAVELALKGVVLCVLGLLFPLLILFGAIPLYYGARKVAAVRLGIVAAEETGERVKS